MVGSSKFWSMATTVGAVAAAVAVRRGLDEMSRRKRGTSLPTNPAEHGVRWREALVWGAGTGAVVGLARVCGQRVAAGMVQRLRVRRGRLERLE